MSKCIICDIEEIQVTYTDIDGEVTEYESTICLDCGTVDGDTSPVVDHFMKTILKDALCKDKEK